MSCEKHACIELWLFSDLKVAFHRKSILQYDVLCPAFLC